MTLSAVGPVAAFPVEAVDKTPEGARRGACTRFSCNLHVMLFGKLAASWVLAAVAGCGSNHDEPDKPVADVLDQPFHREGMVDATNLIIRGDGTLTWRIFGCDFDSWEEAPWTSDGCAVVVNPDDGAEFGWMGDWGLLRDIERVTLTPTDGGEALAVRITFSNGDPPEDQEWLRGGVCAQCGGPLGPTGQKPCDDPFTQHR